MKVLIIGGTGVISTHVRRLVEQQKNEVTVINRGRKAIELDSKTHYIKADVNDIECLKEVIDKYYFDTAIDFVSFSSLDILNRYKLLKGKIGQFVFISSATVYNVRTGVVTENSPIGNVFNEYAKKR